MRSYYQLWERVCSESCKSLRGKLDKSWLVMGSNPGVGKKIYLESSIEVYLVVHYMSVRCIIFQLSRVHMWQICHEFQ